ncbi:restriction endonuclease subunit S [Microlunatus ginsengisoli]|uniref:restriction endonuclease subunit S n=1 Tax=Microlunatus ginsengisoli TaxID=363863 RepID=UPI0031DEB1AA
MKWLLVERDSRAGNRWEERPLLSVSITWGVRRRDAVTSDIPKALDLSNYKTCEPGDLVINRMRAFQGALGIAPEAGLVSPDYSVLRPVNMVNRSWLAYVMRSGEFVSEMASVVRGIGGTESGNVRTPRLNVSELGQLTVDLPSLAEQVAIADFLDRETARIDTLIAKQQQLIETLRERRTSLVNSAVTTGLHKRPMRDSGDSMLGMVPVDWSIGLGWSSHRVP